jgi:hypothetical protein
LHQSVRIFNLANRVGKDQIQGIILDRPQSRAVFTLAGFALAD